jgi:hypothetical protein
VQFEPEEIDQMNTIDCVLAVVQKKFNHSS